MENSMSAGRIVCTLIIVLSLTTGCERSGDGAGQAVVYRHALDGVPASLDPAHASDVYSATLVVNLFDTLYRYRYLARPYELAPNLAAELPEVSDDGRVWTIRLRENVRFVDDPAFADGRGRAVTATDVVYSLSRHFDPATRSQGAWLWRDRIRGIEEWAEAGADHDRPIEGLRARDDHTVVIELNDPYPQLTHTLAMALSAIVPREAVVHYGREFGVRPVGSGPFRLERLDESRAVLQRNPDFDRGALDLATEGYASDLHDELELDQLDGREYPFVDRLEVHFITEPTARWTSFVAGEVDNVMVPAEQAGRVLASRDPIRFRPEIEQRYQTLVSPEAGFVLYGFNMANDALGHHPEAEQDAANRSLRCAMREAFDWQSRNESFYHGLGRVFPGVIPPFLDAWDDRLNPASVTHAPESARHRLLDLEQTDYKLPELTYGLEASVHQRQMFEQFRALMTEVGLPGERLRRRSFASFGEFSRAISNRELDLFLMGWTMAWPDAQYALQLFYGPNAAPGANSFNYSNPEFDQLFEQATRLPPGEERTALYRRLNEIAIDDCVFIGSLSRTRLHLWKRHVHMLPDREVLGGYFLRFVAPGESP
jgi:oligopeptide transport system substrate-binding protein